jgi:hypothetical protein
MLIRTVRKPGEPGTQKLLAKYGNRLVSVRYRYDPANGKRYKTVELIVARGLASSPTPPNRARETTRTADNPTRPRAHPLFRARITTPNQGDWREMGRKQETVVCTGGTHQTHWLDQKDRSMKESLDRTICSTTYYLQYELLGTMLGGFNHEVQRG